MAEYIQSAHDEENIDNTYLSSEERESGESSESFFDCIEGFEMPNSDTRSTRTEISEDLSLLQLFLPEYSEPNPVPLASIEVSDQINELLEKTNISSEESFLDTFSKYLESLKLRDSLFFKLTVEILSEHFTEEQFLLNLPQYYNCESTFIHRKFSSDIHFASVRDYLKWVSSNKKVKGVCNAVPYGILPKGISAELTDVRVNCFGADDKLYETNKVLREKVARGNSMVTFFGKEAPNGGCVVRGLKKFSGGYWDDDDMQHTDHAGWSKYFLSAPSTASSVVVMEKVNGEAAHVSARLLGHRFLIFCGSKNVHLLVTRRDHLLKYQDQRYAYACIIGEAFFDLLEGMSETHRVRLLSFLAHTGYTAIFELLQPSSQHIVNLSYLKAPILKFITWVPSDLGGKECICSMPPHIAIDLASYLGLPTAKYRKMQITELPAELVAIRTSIQSEGAVLYFMDGKQEIIGLLKFKSIWYILLRAVREILKFQMNQVTKGKVKYKEAKSNGSELIKKRFYRINKSLRMTEKSFVAWESICTEFFFWVVDFTKSGKFNRFYSNFPDIWERFLKDSSQKEPQIQIRLM